MYSDFTKSPQQILTELINDASGEGFQPEQFIFGSPEAVSAHGVPRNTKIAVQGVPQEGTMGLMEIHYDRVDINLVPGTRSRTFSGTSLAEIVTAINTAYQLSLTSSDYLANTFPSAGGMGELVISATSMLFRGRLNYQRATIT